MPYDKVPVISVVCPVHGRMVVQSPFGNVDVVISSSTNCPVSGCGLSARIDDGFHDEALNYQTFAFPDKIPPLLVKRLQAAKANLESGAGFDEETLAVIEAVSPALGAVAKHYGKSQFAQLLLHWLLTWILSNLILAPFLSEAERREQKILEERQVSALEEIARDSREAREAIDEARRAQSGLNPNLTPPSAPPVLRQTPILFRQQPQSESPGGNRHARRLAKAMNRKKR